MQMRNEIGVERATAQLPFLRSMRARLLFWFLLLAVIPLALVGVLAYLQAQSSLRDAAYEKLEAVRGIKATEIGRYLVGKGVDTVRVADVAQVLRQDAFAKLARGREEKTAALLRMFQDWTNDILSVSSDSNMINNVQDLTDLFQELGALRVRELDFSQTYSGDEGAFLSSYQSLDDFFSNYGRIHGYEQVFLIDPTGLVVYAMRRGAVLGTDLDSGPYRNSNLAALFWQIKSSAAQQASFVDIAAFSDTDPTDVDAPMAMFVGMPIFDGSGELLSTLVYQVPFASINQVVQLRAGLGETGETCLVGKGSGLPSLRSDLVIKEGKIGDPQAGAYLERAFSGVTGTDIEMSNDGVVEIVDYGPLDIPGLNWIIVTTMNLEEATVPALAGEAQDFYTQYTTEYGYGNLYLINRNGYVYYTTAHEADYQTNLVDGPYRGSNIARLFRQVIETRRSGFADFEPYEPLGGAPVAFLAAPLVFRDRVEVVVVVELVSDEINAIIQERTGLGQTGETYLVGPDNRMRSNSRLDPEHRSVAASFMGTVEENGVDTKATRKALAGETGTDLILDYRDQRVLSAWTPIDVFGETWALLVEQDEAEAFAAVIVLRNVSAAVAGLTMLIVVFVASRIAFSISNPVVHLTEVARVVADGNLDIQATVESNDEIGLLGDAFNQMTRQLGESVGALEESTRILERRAEYLSTASEVARDVARVQDPQRLLDRVVSLVSIRFGFYHAGIFLIDESGEWAVLRAASSEGGRRMLARGHRLRVGVQGMVGYVTGQGVVRVASDVEADQVHWVNPDLAETRAEMVAPLRVGAEVIGALDVQSTQAGAFSDQDVEVMQTLADQVAVALRNVQLVRQAQDALVAERRAYGEISREAWAELIRARPHLGYRYDGSGTVPLSQAQSEGAVSESLEDEAQRELALPVQVRGNTIGAITAHKLEDAADWSDDEVALIEAMLDRLAPILDSAQMYRASQRRAAREQMTRQIIDQVRSADSIEEILQAATRALSRELDVAEAVIRLGTETTLISEQTRVDKTVE